jgi:hypothetical protein
MITFLGAQMGTVFQGGTLLAVLGLALVWWIRGAPERARAKNEARKIEADEHTLIRTDYVQQIKDWRVEVHALRNELHALEGEQRKSSKDIAAATSLIRNYEDDRRTMLFLIRLLISELERLDPNSIIVRQAKETLEQMGHRPEDQHRRDEPEAKP